MSKGTLRRSVWTAPPEAAGALPDITLIRGEQAFLEAVAANTNLVVRAGVRKFPWPHLRYGCGMGQCGKCASRILAGAEHLAEPNWKERQVLGEQALAEGCRLMCQLWLAHDLTLTQDGVAVVAPPAAAAPASG
jgi:ferredoxin